MCPMPSPLMDFLDLCTNHGQLKVHKLWVIHTWKKIYIWTQKVLSNVFRLRLYIVIFVILWTRNT